MRIEPTICYVVEAMAYIAAHDSCRPCGARANARHAGVTEQFVARILQRLAAAGLIVGHANVPQDQSLSVPTDHIAIAGIVAVTEPGSLSEQPLRDSAIAVTEELTHFWKAMEGHIRLFLQTVFLDAQSDSVWKIASGRCTLHRREAEWGMSA